jgi:hypothetical protein
MENAIVKIKASDYGLEETQAQEIAQTFAPILNKATELELRYNEIINLPRTKENVVKFKALRKEYQDSRIGMDECHAKVKRYWLNGSKFVDAFKTIYTATAGEKEKKLKEAEDFEKLEAQRLKNELFEKRRAELDAVSPDIIISTPIADMSEEAWQIFVTGVIQQRKIKEEAEAKAKEEAERKRIEEAEEKARMKAENDRLVELRKNEEAVKEKNAKRLQAIKKYLPYGNDLDLTRLHEYEDEHFELLIQTRKEKYDEAEKRQAELEADKLKLKQEQAKLEDEKKIAREKTEAEARKAELEKHRAITGSDAFKWLNYLNKLSQIEKPALTGEAHKARLENLSAVLKNMVERAEYENKTGYQK